MTDKIPFDVDKWKSSKYDVVNEEGIVRSIIMHEVECEYPISVVSANKSMETYTVKGIYNVHFPTDSECNLFLTPKKRKVWVAISKAHNDFGRRNSAVMESEQEAIMFSMKRDDHYIVEVELPE